MKFTETNLPGAYIIELEPLQDERGFFARGFCKKEFDDLGLNTYIAQANISSNVHKGTLRGLHLQMAPFAETKLVRCTRGSIYDVIVDLRKNSATYKQWIGVELTGANYKMLYVPEGFAHSFITLQDRTDVMYHVTQYYNAASERGYRWNDPAFGIEWPLQPVVISPRDQNHPDYKDDL